VDQIIPVTPILAGMYNVYNCWLLTCRSTVVAFLSEICCNVIYRCIVGCARLSAVLKICLLRQHLMNLSKWLVMQRAIHTN